MNVMFDTNIFNHILDNPDLIGSINSEINIFATHVQKDEISRTKNKDRKNKLLSLFKDLTTKKLPSESFVIGTSRIGQAKITGNVIATESAVWSISKWDECKWGGKVVASNFPDATASFNLYKAVLCELNKRNNNKPNNKEDALIAETAIKNNLILITHDGDLFSVVTNCFKAASMNLYAMIDATTYPPIHLKK